MALSIKTGTYTGNGSTSANALAITGVGFRPKFLIIFGDTAQYEGNFFLDTSGGAGTQGVGYTFSPGDNGGGTDKMVNSYDADGFTLMASGATTGDRDRVNVSGVTYHYLAIGGTDVAVGSFTGNGSSQTISAPGFQPEWVMVQGGNQHMGWKSLYAAATSESYRSTGPDGDTYSNEITSITSTGFTVGSGAVANASGTTMWYVAVKHSSATNSGRYTGNGSSQSISGIGFQPKFVMVDARSSTTSTETSWDKIDTMTGGVAAHQRTSGLQTGGISSMDATGFTLGSGAGANTSGIGYDWFALGPATVTYTKSAVATVAGTPAIGKLATFLKALQATVTGFASALHIAARIRAIVATVAGTTVAGHLATRYRAFQVTVTGVSSVLHPATFLKALAATATGVAVNAYGKAYVKALQAIAVGQASVIQLRVKKIVSIVATAAASTSVARQSAYLRSVIAIATASPSIGKALNISMAFVATAAAGATIGMGRQLSRSLIAVAQAMPGVSKQLNISMMIRAIATGTAKIAELYGYLDKYTDTYPTTYSDDKYPDDYPNNYQ